jgi:ankyrin repeat protein
MRTRGLPAQSRSPTNAGPGRPAEKPRTSDAQTGVLLRHLLPSAPEAVQRAQLVHLQRIVGNQAVGQLLRTEAARQSRRQGTDQARPPLQRSTEPQGVDASGDLDGQQVVERQLSAVQRMNITIGEQTLDTEKERDRARIKRLLGAMAPDEAWRIFRAARRAASRAGEDPYDQPGAQEIDTFLGERETTGSGTSSDTSRSRTERRTDDSTRTGTPGAGTTTPSSSARSRPERRVDDSSRATTTTGSTLRSRPDRGSTESGRDSTAASSTTRPRPERRADESSSASRSRRTPDPDVPSRVTTVTTTARARPARETEEAPAATPEPVPEVQDVNALDGGLAKLHIAAARGSSSDITALVAAGARIDIKATMPPYTGKTPLRIALDQNQQATFAQLLALRPDPFIADDRGVSPWSLALGLLDKEANARWINEIVASNAVDWTTATGKTCLVALVQTGDVPVITRLLNSKHLTVDQPLNADGHTALHLLAQGDRAEASQLLLQRGAVTNIKDSKGRYPIALASHERMKAVLEAGTEAATLQPPPKATTGDVPSEFDAMIYFQDPAHTSMFKGLAEESYKSALLKSLMDSMVAAAQRQTDLKIIGASDAGIFNATIVPGLAAAGRAGVKGWTPHKDPQGDRIYFSAGDPVATIREKWGTVLHEATHAMMQRIFKNTAKMGDASAPFAPVEGGNELKDAFLKIVEDIRTRINAKQFPSGTTATAITGAYNEEGYDASSIPGELIVRVPQILGELGNAAGEAWLTQHVPQLLGFWKGQIMPRLEAFARNAPQPDPLRMI